MKLQAILLSVCAIATTVLLLIPAGEQAAPHIRTRILLDQVPAERIASIRIAAWNAKRLNSQSIQIEKQHEAWVLPQHYYYPADAGAKVGSLLAAVIGLELGQAVPADTQLWSAYRLHDPLADNGTEQDRCGRRLSITAANGEELLDVIIGAEVTDAPGYRYLRFVKEQQVYRVPFEPALPTRFVDWVDTTLLPINGADLRFLAAHYYSVDAERRKFRPNVKVQFMRKHMDSLWQSPNANEGDVTDEAAIYRVLRGALESRIYGVKPFHKDLRNMEAYGFYSAQSLGPTAGRNPIVGRQGRVDFGTKDGLTYYCYLGAVVQEDLGLSGGTSGIYRYVMLACNYNPVEDRAYDGTNAKELLEIGREKAGQFNKRYTKFVYIIDEEDFKQLLPDYMSLFKKPEQEKQP